MPYTTKAITLLPILTKLTALFHTEKAKVILCIQLTLGNLQQMLRIQNQQNKLKRTVLLMSHKPPWHNMWKTFELLISAFEVHRTI